LIPLALPVAVQVFAEGVWKSSHAAREPKLDAQAGRLIVAPESVLSRGEWEAEGRRIRERLTLLLWLLYGTELALMSCAILFQAERQGWHDRLAGTFVIRRSAPTDST
jgi:hypothetical protein